MIGIGSNLLFDRRVGKAQPPTPPIYAVDFNTWVKNLKAANFTNSDSVIHLTEILVADSKFLQTSVDATISSYQVKVEGITDDIKLRYVSYAEDGTGTYTYLKNGINNLPISYKKYTGFAASVVGVCNITITQLPIVHKDPAWYMEAIVCEYNPIKQGCTNQNMSTDNVLRDLSGNGYNMTCYNFAWNTQSGIYDDGSLILDGVDDYLKVIGLPIMDDFTVMVQNYKYDFKPSILASKSYPTANDGAFMLENIDGGGRGSLRSFGNPGWVTYIQETINVMAMTKTECYKDSDNNISFFVTPGTGVDSDTLWIGKIRDNNSVFGKTRLYSFLMFNRSLTKEEMDWVRNNKMNK